MCEYIALCVGHAAIPTFSASAPRALRAHRGSKCADQALSFPCQHRCCGWEPPAHAKKIMSGILGMRMCTAAYQASRGATSAARLRFRILSGPAARSTASSSLTKSQYQDPLAQNRAACRCLSVTPSASHQWHAAAARRQPCVGLRTISPPGSCPSEPYVRYRATSASGSETLGQQSGSDQVTEKAVAKSDDDDEGTEEEEEEEGEGEELVELTDEELALSEGIEAELKELLGDREGEGGSIPWRFADEDELDTEEDEEDNTQPGDGLDGGGVVLGGASWGQQLLGMAQGVLDDPQFADEGLALFGFRIYPERRLVRIRIEKLTDKFGSPSIDELEAFLKQLHEEVLAAEARKDLPEDVQIEVSTPGAERVLEVPKDLSRFSHFPMYVCYNEHQQGSAASPAESSTAESSSSTVVKHEVFELVEVDSDGGAVVWKVADVRINRELLGKGRRLNKKQREGRICTPFQDINVVRIYLDV